MRILALQFLSAVGGRPAPRFEPQLASLLALLRERGHEIDLIGMPSFDLPRVKQALAKGLPQLIYADISAVCSDVARRTLQHLDQREFLPVVVGGEHASIDPESAVSLPGVTAVALGEPDAPLVTYLERIRDPSVAHVVRGVWVRDERGLERPAMPDMVEDLDSLPFAERRLFGYDAHVARGGPLEIAIGRGCEESWGYSLNERLARLYAGRGTWARRRSAEQVMQEIDALARAYAGAQRVRFLDDSFALSRPWLEELLDAYAAACPLPFECRLRANRVAGLPLERLARAGCRQVEVDVISASALIRNDIFQMDLSVEQIVETFARLREAGLRRRARVLVGAPYESEASLDAAVRLLERIEPNAIDARPYYPWPGTRGAEVCRENGWLHSRGEEQLHRDEPGIDMPACRPPIVMSYLRRMRKMAPSAPAWWRRWPSRRR